MRPPPLLELQHALPWTIPTIAAAAVSHAGGAGWGQILLFTGYLALCITVPGVLCWRLIWKRSEESWLDQLVFGTLLGVLIQLPVYLIGLVAGFPRLPVLIPVALLAAVLVRRDRRELLRPTLERVPAGLAWVMSLASVQCIAWIGGIGWLIWPYSDQAPAAPNGDQPFQLAVITDLKHRLPGDLPFLQGEPLDYHWFVNAFLAASSWITGLPPALLLDRLFLLPTLILIVAAVGLIAYRLTRSALGAALAVVLLALVGNFSPFPAKLAISSFNELFLSFWDPLSPSLDFGTAMLLLAVHVLLRVLNQDRPVRRELVLLFACFVMLTGAKATLLPIVVAGLVGALIARRIFGGGPSRPLWISLGLAVAAFGFAELVLYGGSSQGLRIAPMHLAGYVAGKLGLPIAIAGLLLLVSWSCAWVGVPLLLAKHFTRMDSRAAFLVAAGCGGLVATLLLGHPQYSEDYFIRACVPLLAIASAWGLSSRLALMLPRPRTKGIALGAAGGLAAAYLGRGLAPRLPSGSGWLTALVPYAVVGVILVALVLGAVYYAVRSPRSRVDPLIVGVVAVASLGLTRPVDTAIALADRPWRKLAPADRQTAPIGLGGFAAAKWVRNHTGDDDLVATNAHYRRPNDKSDNRAFWIAAHTERQLLLEGWGYTPTASAAASRRGVSTFGIEFSDPQLLAVNDAAFTRPSVATVQALRRQHAVRWLFVDTRFPVDLAGLSKVAKPRYRNGDYAVLEIR